MRMASSVISMIFPKTMSPAFTGGRSRGGPCFFSFFLSRSLGAAFSSVASGAGAPPAAVSSPRCGSRLGGGFFAVEGFLLATPAALLLLAGVPAWPGCASAPAEAPSS